MQDAFSQAVPFANNTSRDQPEISEVDRQSAEEALRSFPGLWQVHVEEDYGGEKTVMLLAEDDVAPDFLLCRSGGPLQLTSWRHDDVVFEGAFGSAAHAVESAVDVAWMCRLMDGSATSQSVSKLQGHGVDVIDESRGREPTRVTRLAGENLRAAREEAGISVTDLANAVGLPIERIQAIEAGYERPTGAELVAAAEALKIPLTRLFDGA